MACRRVVSTAWSASTKWGHHLRTASCRIPTLRTDRDRAIPLFACRLCGSSKADSPLGRGRLFQRYQAAFADDRPDDHPPKGTVSGRRYRRSGDLSPRPEAPCARPNAEDEVLAATRKKPADGSTHWSCRQLAAALHIRKQAVHRICQEVGIQPHRLERYMASNDPDFETKAADTIGLYLNPPSMLPCAVSMRRQRSRSCTGWIRCCHCRQAAPTAMASNTTSTAHSRCMPRWTPRPGKGSARLPAGTPARVRRLPRSGVGAAPNPAAGPHHPGSMCSCTLCRPTHPG